MQVFWYQLWEIVAFSGLLFISNRISGPLGAMFHFLISMTIRIRWIGRFFQFLLQKPIYLNAVTKPLAWLISSSGLLLGIVFHDFFWGSPNTTIEYWILLLFAITAILEILHSILTFDAEYYYIDKILESANDMPFFKRHLSTSMNYVDEGMFIRLARSTFVDQALPQFFRLLLSIGVTYYAITNLKLIQTVSPDLPTIWESIGVAFSLIDITGEITVPFTGTTWEIIRLVSAFISFFWLAMFITLVSSSVDEAATKAHEKAKERSENRMHEILEFLYAQISKQTPSTNTEIATSSIKSADTLVGSVEIADSGNETATLHNFSEKTIPK